MYCSTNGKNKIISTPVHFKLCTFFYLIKGDESVILLYHSIFMQVCILLGKYSENTLATSAFICHLSKSFRNSSQQFALKPHWGALFRRYALRTSGVKPGTSGRLFSDASVYVHHMASLLGKVSIEQQRHGAMRPHGQFLPAGRGVSVCWDRLQTPRHPGGGGAVDAAAGLWERKRGLDPHRLDRGGEDRLLCDGSEQPAPGGRLILHGAPKSAVWRHEAHVTSCKWHHNPLRIFHRPVMCHMLSMSTAPPGGPLWGWGSDSLTSGCQECISICSSSSSPVCKSSCYTRCVLWNDLHFGILSSFCVIHICGTTLYCQMYYMQTFDRLTTIGRRVRLVFVWHTWGHNVNKKKSD